MEERKERNGRKYNEGKNKGTKKQRKEMQGQKQTEGTEEENRRRTKMKERIWRDMEEERVNDERKREKGLKNRSKDYWY